MQPGRHHHLAVRIQMNPCRKPGARSWHRRTADRILVCVQTSLDQPTLHPIQGLKRRGGRGDRRHQGEQQQTQGLHHKAGASEAHPHRHREHRFNRAVALEGLRRGAADAFISL
tara:strand:- start:161 stop:502 length:342 start_codon:yes stop_codon:yes gene_type:complete